MIRIFQKTIKDTEIREVDELKTGSWIYIEHPTEGELDLVASRYGLERDLLTDAIDPNEVPRVEAENGVMYTFTRFPHREGDMITTVPVLVGIADNFIFTVCIEPLPFLDRFLSGKIDFSTTQKTKLYAQIFTEINLLYTRFLTDIARAVRGLSGHFRDLKNDDILQFVLHERTLSDFLAALMPTETFLQSILSGRTIQRYEEDRDLIEDLFLASGQLVQMCQSNLKAIVNIREAYSTVITNNLNSVIKLLTALTVVLTIPTMIASFFGMNVPIPIEDSPHAFASIVAGTMGVSTLMLLVFFWRRWL